MTSRRLKVSGVIYLHPITANRGQPEEEYNRLRKLSLGKLSDVPVILVTTFWRPDAPIQEARLQELEERWNSAEIRGPPSARYNDSADCAWDIVRSMEDEMNLT
jgi:hypothetical protein